MSPLAFPRLRRLLSVWMALVIATLPLVGGCGSSSDNSHVKLPAPMESTTLGPGDIFQMQIVGEKDLPEEYQVASDGTVDLPYIHRLTVAGLEPQQVARLIRQELMKKKILTDPSVVVSAKEYNSKKITVSASKARQHHSLRHGDQAIRCRWLTSIASKDRINLTHKPKARTVGSASTR
jgi:polysaccharide export outer membrane protein